jgi:D-glycero-D-manno-heptose 1,7-bisphosphate phosphatase
MIEPFLKHKAVFLDRDGIINKIIFRNGRLSAPFNVGEFEILHGVKEAINIFKQNGFLCLVITSQPDIGRGNFEEEELKEINDFLRNEYGLNAIYYCIHVRDGECECKKPKPGLLFRAAQELDIDLRKSFIIGDRWRDIEAGEAAGCRTILIPTEATVADEWRNKEIKANFVASNLLDAARLIIQNT